MLEEAWDIGDFVVACGREVLDKAVIGEDAGLREAVHAFSDLDDDVPIVDERL